MRYIYLSPHFDDAVYSCGGMLHRQFLAQKSITVITLFGGAPDYTNLSDFVRDYHREWGNHPDPIAVRRSEDQEVLGRWKITPIHFDSLDGIYRNHGGNPTYPDLQSLFGNPDPNDLEVLPELWLQHLKEIDHDKEDTLVVAPLAAGNHVDHQIARTFGLRLFREGYRLWFYEDFPHAEDPATITLAREWFAVANWEDRLVPIDVNAKIEAIRGYKSQISQSFGSDALMVKRVKRFTAERAVEISALERIRYKLASFGGRRERLWRLIFGYHAHAERFWRFLDGK